MPKRYDNSVYFVSVGTGLLINIEQDVIVLLCQPYINEKCTGVTFDPFISEALLREAYPRDYLECEAALQSLEEMIRE